MSYLGRSAKLSLKAQEKVSFLATAGQTSKTGLSYVPSFVEVYVNGILLTDTTDFTATNGNSVTFTVALSLNDEVTVVSLKTFTVADHYTKSDANALLAAKATNTAVALKAPLANPSFTGGTSNASNLSTSFSTAAIKVQPKTTSGWSLVTGSGPSDIPYLQTTAGGAAAGAMTINPYGGNVGIGTSSPLSKLDVSGGFLTVSKDANTAGRVGASEYITGSTANDLIVQATGSGVTKLYQSGVNSLNINAAGIVTKPLQPAFNVNASTEQSDIVSGATIVLGNENFDVGGNFSGNTFTAPITGKYQLNVTMRINHADEAATFIRFYLSTSNKTYETIYDLDGLSADPAYWAFNMSVLADMDAGDTAHLIYSQAGGSASADIDTPTTFSGYLAC